MNEENKTAELKPLLLVDDDETFCEVLSHALTKRHYDVSIAHSVSAAETILETSTPDFAIVDLRMPESYGLDLIPKLCEKNPEIRIVVLTGYASIATAIEAIKLGATHYLTKPADADEIVAAFDREKGKTDTEVGEQPLALDRLEWEHIQKVLADCNGNISAAARRLKLHRRTLQRKLQKRPSGIQ